MKYSRDDIENQRKGLNGEETVGNEVRGRGYRNKD